MFNTGTLTFREFIMREPLPLATIQNAVLEFLRQRDDAVVFGAQAVNAYVDEPRMTQDIDLLSTRAADLAQELREHLSQKFHIAIRVQEIGEGRGFHLFQVQKSGNRHLVDIRPVLALPPAQRIEEVLVIAPADLIPGKVIAYHQRRGKPKSGEIWQCSCSNSPNSRASKALWPTDCRQAAQPQRYWPFGKNWRRKRFNRKTTQMSFEKCTIAPPSHLTGDFHAQTIPLPANNGD